MSYILNFPAEILPVLAYDLGSTYQALGNSSFYMMGVVGLEM
jgi:hypothetical protein